MGRKARRRTDRGRKESGYLEGGFVDGELDVFCYDHNGINMAHGGNKSLVGRNLLHIKDPDGAEPNLLIVKVGFAQVQGLERDRQAWVCRASSREHRCAPVR